MNKKTTVSIFAAVILLCQASAGLARHNSNTFYIPAYHVQGNVIAPPPPAYAYIYVQPDMTFSNNSINPYAGGVYDGWYQNNVWAPGYTIVKGNSARWVPGGWVYR